MQEPTEITEKTQNGVPQGSITDPLLIIQIISSRLFASTNVQRVVFFLNMPRVKVMVIHY